MALCKKTEKQLEEVYKNHRSYLNDKNECPELHSMCINCEKYSGEKQHDYEKCKSLPCFRNWLGLAYLDWYNGY